MDIKKKTTTTTTTNAAIINMLPKGPHLGAEIR